MPGWSRLRHGRGFRYVDQDGAALDAEQIRRCKELVIPPAWEAVWICPAPNGHLQAVGTDDAGRRQYLYHPEWRVRRDLEKFAHMERFAASLLKHRTATRRDLALAEGGPDLTTVAATAFSLLDLGMFRIGSQRYAEENGSYGLTTIEKSHVRPSGRGLTFSYTAKSGQEVDVTVRDDRVRTVLDRLRTRRAGGDGLLAYRVGRLWHPLHADDVNTYIKERLGDEFSAKDFRTWRGTVIAALALAQSSQRSSAHTAPLTETARRKAVAAAMREVSDHLGNTAAVARSSYVDPRIVDLYADGVTVSSTHRRVSPGAPVSRTLERQVLRLLRRS